MKKHFDKYWYYRQSVQSPEIDIKFISNCYKRLKKREAYIFREDFCSTFSLSCEWVKQSEKHKALSIDINPTPLNYGRKHYLPLMSKSERSRITLVCSDVLKKRSNNIDIVCAMNFSYFIFKKREEMKKYFSQSLKSLNKNGLLIIDCFGGSKCYEANEQIEKLENFTYYWDQKNFDPISNKALFQIHYKRKREKKREKVFTYEMRLWSLPELQDILTEVGFRKIHIYWEGSNKDGTGNSVFKPRKKGEECEAWIAYIISEK